MGSILTEPDGGISHTSHNFTTICTFANRIHCNTGVFAGANPLEFSVPLLFLQLGICSGTIILFSKFLKHLGQPLIISQILGGLFLGSSGLSHLEKLRETKIDKNAFGIGSCSAFLAFILATIYSMTLLNFVDIQTFNYLLALGRLEALINLPMVSSLLYELHLINSEFGRMALSTAMASTIISICLQLLAGILDPHGETRDEALSNIFAIIMFIVVIAFVFQHVTLWMIKKNPIGQPLKECFVITLLLGVLVVAFCCQAFGLQIYFGPFLLGFIIPSGPPIGSTLVERLDFITSWVFMPIFFAKIGLVVNIYTIKLMNFLYMSFIVFVGALGKLLGALMVSIYYKLPMRDALSLGLILNSQGALELGIFKIRKKEKIIDDEAFVVGCICMLVIVAIITPIIRYLLDPSRRYIVHGRRTMMHSRPEFDLCILVCIHDQEDVPSAINILDALNPTRRSHLIVYMLHLVELIGRAQPKLIHHKHTKIRTLSSCSSEPIVNAFKYFGEMYCGIRFHSNGMISSSKHKIKIVNKHILEKAPCSVALVVERGFSKVSKSITNNLNSFQIAVVFIGGPDDREAMFIGARMVGHSNINLTVIRLVEDENVLIDNIEEKKLDDEAVVEFRQIIADTYKVRYIEEVVKDGTGTICVLRSMGSNFNLVMVGRRHSPCLASVQGLVLWNECTELGAIGQVLASSDFMGNAMIFVVQQHTRVAIDEDQQNHQQTIISMDNIEVKDDAKELPIQ
ncbi:unnamed protein product [Citrullus colocynthis]|uniref:Cation/H+ exchanger domain-containing protein n=1 Tax=Citrullus colocynthis TaxID=252529 RepID=A0ABP0Z8X1_9ROSI